MGACSTIRVTERAAMKYLVDKILFSMTRQEIEDLLDEALRSRSYNAIVVDADSENDDELLRPHD